VEEVGEVIVGVMEVVVGVVVWEVEIIVVAVVTLERCRTLKSLTTP